MGSALRPGDQARFIALAFKQGRRTTSFTLKVDRPLLWPAIARREGGSPSRTSGVCASDTPAITKTLVFLGFHIIREICVIRGFS